MEKTNFTQAVPAPRHPPQIILAQERARAFWCREFSCSEAQLRQAVETVGSQVKDVRAYFWKTRHTRKPVHAAARKPRAPLPLPA